MVGTTIRILSEVFPQTKPTGKDEATAIRDDAKVLPARIRNGKLEKAGVKHELGAGGDLITNELIDEINRFDPHQFAAEAKAYKPR